MKKDNWTYKVFFMTFILSVIFSFISNLITNNSNIFIMILITILFIIIGIIFDMIGMASLTSSEATFHAKSSRKIKGAKESLEIIDFNLNLVTSLYQDTGIANYDKNAKSVSAMGATGVFDRKS